MSVSLTRAQLKDKTIRAEIAKLQQDAEILDAQRARLVDLVELLNEPEFLEQEARRSLGYVKPGEKVVVIERSEECRIKNEECKDESPKELSNPKKWWVYFFGGS